MLDQRDVFEKQWDLKYTIERIAATIQNDFQLLLKEPNIYTEEVLLNTAEIAVDVDALIKTLTSEVVQWGKDVKSILKDSTIKYKSQFIENKGEEAFNKIIENMVSKLEER